MTEHDIPTEQELDALLAEQPRFDLDAVKGRTLSRIEAVPERPRRRRAPLRGLLTAAVICVLSISAVAAADYATEGRISTALGIRREPVAETAAETAVPAEAGPPVPEAPPVQAAEPESEPVEPPELDEQIAAALQVDTAQAQRLRPAVQAVEQTAEDQDIRMTVLQTLGDPSCLYVKLRFDFPEGSPLAAIGAGNLWGANQRFEDFDVELEGTTGYSCGCTVLEQSETSVTLLIDISDFHNADLNGRAITVTAKNYGSPHKFTEDEVLHLAGDAGKPFTTIIRPDGTMLWDATEEDLAAVSGEVTAVPLGLPAGFNATRRADGNIVVSYDGLHGDQVTDVYWVPRFDTMIEGTWEMSWKLSYQDISLYWKGETSVFDPALTATELRLSPLSLEISMIAKELTGEALMWGLVPHSYSMQLRHRDGSLTDISVRGHHGGAYKPTEDGIYTVTEMTEGCRFDQPIDLSDVTAVVINGVEFPLS